jgi:predicted dienelactone hydrolase
MKPRNILFFRILAIILALLLAACTPAAAPLTPEASTAPPPTPTQPQATNTAPPETLAQPAPSATEPHLKIPIASPTPKAANLDYPLADPGPYFVGNKVITYTDESRGGREVAVTVYYPALRSPNASGLTPPRDAAPDPGGAPYPLIVSSTKMARSLAPILVSHGFTWAGVDRIDTYMKMEQQMYEQPLDILFMLDQVAAHPPEGLEGMIDAEHAGAIGYSFDGYNTLAMSGARIDPEYYLAQCQAPDEAVAAIIQTDMTSFSCTPAEDWEDFAAQAGEEITVSEDGLWQPLSDPRLKAVMPLAAEGWWLFGERGLAAADRPTLMIVATNDSLYPENALIFDHLGSPDKVLISILNRDHMMIYDPKMVERIAHFAAAFFGYHLQGRQDLAEYFSEEFVSQKEGLYWGVYPGD